MKKITIGLILLLVASEALSAHYYRNRTIVGAGVYYSGQESVLLITVDGDLSEMASCAGNARLAINSTAPHFKEIVSMVLTAYASGQSTVDVYVDEQCTYFSGAENILGIKIGNMVF